MLRTRVRNKLLYIVAGLIIVLMFSFTFVDNVGGTMILIFKKLPEGVTSADNYIMDMMHYDNFAIFGWRSFQMLLPIFSVIATIHYREEIYNYFPHAFTRGKRYKKKLLSFLLCNAGYIALVFYLAYVLSLCLGLLVFPINKELNWFREVYADILGPSFYMNNKFAYYVLEGVIKVILPVFFYSLFSMCICLYTKKKSLPLVIPVMYHFCMVFAVPLACTILNEYNTLIYFAPQNLIVPAAIIKPSTIGLLVGFSPYLIICSLFILFAFYKKERVV